jgi:hypothetical protein
MLLDKGIVGSINLKHAPVVYYTSADAEVTFVDIRLLLDPELMVAGCV